MNGTVQALYQGSTGFKSPARDRESRPKFLVFALVTYKGS